MNSFATIVLKDNLLGCPFAPVKRFGIGTAAALGVGATGLGLFNSIVNAQMSQENASMNRDLQRETNELGAKLQRETNNLNAQLQRETNMQNQAMFDKALSWQNDMWQKTNEYNDPSAAVQRMLNAGVNPSVGLAQGGVASTMSSPAAPQMQAAKMDAYKPSFTPTDISAGQFNFDVYNAVNAYNQSRLADQSIKESASRTHGNDLRNEFDAKTLYERIKQLSYLAKQDEANADFYRKQADFYTATFDARKALEFGNVKLQEQQLELAMKSAVSMQLDIDAKQIENRWLPVLKEDQHKQFISALDTAKAEIGLIMANQTLTYSQAETEIQKKIGQIIDNGMKGVDYQIKKDTKKYMVDMAREQLYKLEDEREFRPYQYNYEMQGNAGKWFPSPAGQFGAASVFDRNRKRNRFSVP